MYLTTFLYWRLIESSEMLPLCRVGIIVWQWQRFIYMVLSFPP